MIDSAGPSHAVRGVTRSRFAGSRSTPFLWEYFGLATALVLYASIALILINQGSPLGHDEAVYATRARQILNGDPASGWWGPYRAPGLPYILTAAWVGPGTEPYLRAIVAMSGGALIAFTWLLARLLVSSKVALVAAFGLALTPVILTSATQVWADVPGAAAVMAAFCIYTYGLSQERMPIWVTIGIPLLVGVATLIRFGAPMPLLVGLVGLTLWRWPKDSINKWRVLAAALGSGAAILAILFTPLLTGGTRPIDALRAQTADIPLSQGFIDYWALRTVLFAGAGWVALVGVACGIVLSLSDPSVRKAFLWPLCIGIATFGALAAAVFGHPHYLVPVYPWLWMAAGVGLTALADRLPRVLAVSAGAALVLALVAYAPSLSDDRHRFNRIYTTIKTAATSLNTHESCGVFTSYTPQVAWYSGCNTINIDTTRVDTNSPELPPGPRYLFMVEGGKRQPDDSLMAGYIDRTTQVQSFGAPGQDLQFVQVWNLQE